jgi:hypothetical protein
MLQAAAVRRYQDLPIPADEDALAEEFIREWRKGDKREAGPLDELVVGVLLVFAIRSASRAVRERETEWIRLGLAAVAIVGNDSDPRDLQQQASVLGDACRRVGIDARFLFQEAARNAEGGAATVLQQFGGIREVDLAAHRVLASESPDGFLYTLVR